MPFSTSGNVTTTSDKKQLSDGNGLNGGLGNTFGQSALDLISFYNATTVVQPTAAANVHTVAAGSTTAAYVNTTYDGSIGSTAYTIGDLVKALKQLGLIAS